MAPALPGGQVPRICPVSEFPTLAPASGIQVNGVRLNYQIGGLKQPRNVPVVVLVHGFGASLESWHDIYPHLCGDYQTVRVDLKGFGFSSKPKDSTYSLEDQAELLASFLKGLGLGRVVLVGHSYGGGVALLTYPHR